MVEKDIQQSITNILSLPLADLKQSITKDGNRYYKEGKKYTRVTRAIDIINKPALNKWRENVELEFIKNALSQGYEIDTESKINNLIHLARREPDRIAQEAADIGKFIHRIIDKIGKGEIYNLELLPEPVYYGVSSALKFLDDTKFKMLAGEETLFCDKYMIAGTPDKVGIMDGLLTILDWKSGSVWPTSQLQGATYRYLWWVKTKEWTKKTLMVKLFLDKIDYKIHWQDLTKEDLDYNWKVYLWVLGILRWMEAKK